MPVQPGCSEWLVNFTLVPFTLASLVLICALLLQSFNSFDLASFTVDLTGGCLLLQLAFRSGQGPAWLFLFFD